MQVFYRKLYLQSRDNYHSVLRAEHGEEIRILTAHKIAEALRVDVGELVKRGDA